MDTKKLRQKILDLAIRGKLVPQDPNDEPASVLLERIRAEKERLIKEGKIKRSKKSASDTPHYENEVPFEVPESWEWCKLIDVCHIFGRIGFRGYTKDDLVANDGAITLSPSNIIEGQMNYDNCTYISWDKYEESPEIQIANGDILLVKTGSSFGKCAYVCNLPQEATINPQFVVLKYILCNPRFLTYILQSGYARRNYDEFVLGTAIPTFTQIVLGGMYIPLPSIQEQQRIVNAIEQWSALIDTLETTKENLQTSITQTKSKILDLAIHGRLVPQDPNDEPAIELLKRINPKFTPCDNAHYENVPTNWALARVEDIGQLLSGRDLTNDECNSDNMGLPYLIGASNIEGDTFSFIRWTEKPQVISQMGDILISCKGTIGTIVKNDIGDMHIARQFMAIRPNTNCIISDYLHICLITVIEEIKKDARGVIPGISRDDILTKVFTIPPLNEQRRIVAEMNLYYRVFDNISTNL